MTGVATVLIIGASKGIGFETLKAALETGHSVRALARVDRRTDAVETKGLRCTPWYKMLVLLFRHLRIVSAQ